MAIDSVDMPNVGERLSEENNKKIVKVSELEGRCVYFPLADYHNIRIFKEHSYRKGNVSDQKVKKDIANRLFLALLLFDKVIMHCSDPLRSEVIYEILMDNLELVKSGKILFVFSNSINSIEKDYKKYIQEKISEYERNAFSSTDIDSLKQGHMTEEYYDEVIALLNKTPYMLKKGKDGSSGFKELIQADLDSNVEVAVMGRNNFARSHVRLLNLSLYQLLNLKYADVKEIKGVFEHAKMEEFITTWESDTDEGAPFSRHTIVEQLRKEFLSGSETQKKNQEKVINVIETRLSLLYSKLNCGLHQIIEFHPATEKRSVYNWRYFQSFLVEIAENRNVELTNKKVVEIINTKDEWERFRNEFLSCMADLEAEVAVSQHADLKNLEAHNEMFLRLLKKHKIISKYPKIKEILIK